MVKKTTQLFLGSFWLLTFEPNAWLTLCYNPAFRLDPYIGLKLFLVQLFLNSFAYVMEGAWNEISCDLVIFTMMIVNEIRVLTWKRLYETLMNDILKYQGQKLCNIFQTTIVNKKLWIKHVNLRLIIVNGVIHKFLLYWDPGRQKGVSL